MPIRNFREWYIAAIGIVLIIGGLAIVSYLSAPANKGVSETSSQPVGVDSTKKEGNKASGDQTAKPAQQPTAKLGDSAQSTGKAPAPIAAPPKDTATNRAGPSDGGARTAQAPAVTAPPAPQPEPAAKPQSTPQTQAPGPQPAQGQPGAPTTQQHAAHSAAAPRGDVNAGQQAFRKCQACHSIEPGRNLIGPSLAGVFGRPAGRIAGYNYSPSMKQSGVVWNAQSLDTFLLAPQKFIPKNKMAFPGLRSDSERTNVIAYLAGAASQPAGQAMAQTTTPQRQQTPAARPAPPPATAQQPGTATVAPSSVSYIPDVRYTVRSGIAEGRMVYIGVGGTIDGEVNPILSAAEGQVVQITLLNGEGAEHDIVFPDQNAASPRIVGRGTSTVMVFRATTAGDYVYYCSVAGHRQAGMEGQFLITPRPPDQVVVEADISHLPTDVPQPIGKRDPQTIRVDLVAVELEARLAEGTTYGFWTFNGRVPGPLLRARVGDTLDVHVTNSKDSSYIHSVDFHAATGPGGGAASTQVDPGHTKSFKFKALVPGLYVYHCATPMVAHHITNGMYGLILVEPEAGLPPVDHEFYVMQGEIYTQDAFGQRGRQEFSVEKLLNERPEYFVFNGSVGALSKLHPLKAKVGETVRIFFGVGGPNFTSSFHVIGEIFDRVYSFADLQSPPLRGVQTITVPPGGAAVVEFKVDVPGNYILVDHALSRAERGLVGILQVEGPPDPTIYDGKVEGAPGH
jgi:nitrite reductase (NO-forming)